MRRAASGVSFNGRRVASIERAHQRSSTANVCLFCQQREVQSQHSALLHGPRPFSSTASRAVRARRQTVNSSRQDPTASTPDEEPVVLGGSGDQTTAETNEDLREYQRSLVQEAQDLYQSKVDNAPNHVDFAPASYWSGLRRLGGAFDWPTDEEPAVFNGFIPASRIEDPREILHAVNRAAVEVYAAHSAQLPMKKLPFAGPDDILDSETRNVTMRPSADGLGAILEFPSEQIKEKVMLEVNKLALSKQDEHNEIVEELKDSDDVPKPVTSPGNASEDEAAAISEATEGDLDGDSSKVYGQKLAQGNFGEAWDAVPISNPLIKLAIARRVTQLTGHTFPDPTLHSSQTLGALVSYLRKTTSRPANVFQSMVGKNASEEVGEELYMSRANAARNLSTVIAEDKGAVADLLNVVISDRRVTMIDREKSTGRWKVIREELQRRHLPVPGEQPRDEMTEEGVYR